MFELLAKGHISYCGCPSKCEDALKEIMAWYSCFWGSQGEGIHNSRCPFLEDSFHEQMGDYQLRGYTEKLMFKLQGLGGILTKPGIEVPNQLVKLP